MFKVKIDEDEYKVNFIHKIPEPQQLEMPETLFKTLFGTVCNIWKNGEWWAGWKTDLNPKDQYNRTVGRKLALTNILLRTFPPHQRKMFWDAYYQARSGKW